MTVLVYVAGPFRASTAWGVAENVRAAERVGLQVARAGAYPIIPHANTANFNGECSDDLWLAGTIELMRRCDGIVMMPLWRKSSGARAEHDEAVVLRMSVMYCDVDDEHLRRWVKTLEHSPRIAR